MSSNLCSSAAVARKLILMVLLITEESGREISRFRFGSATLRRVGRRSYIRTAFVEDVAEELAQLGWILITINSDLYAMIKTDRIESWMQVSSTRLSRSFSALPDGLFGQAYKEHILEEEDEKVLSIKDLDDDTVVDIFDRVTAVTDAVDEDED